MKPGRLLVALAVLSLPMPAAAAPRTATLVIDKMKFGPMPTGLRAGDRLTIVNRDIFRHTATARPAFDLDLPAGKGGIVTLKAGTFAVTCRYHPGMRATLIVRK